MSYFYYGADDGQKALEEAPAWTKATEINISIGDSEILETTLQPDQLPALKTLELSGPAITPGLAILSGKLPPRLRTLSLNAQDPFDMRGLSGILGAHQLHVLRIWNYMDETFGPMLDATDTLRQLDISFCLTPYLVESIAPHLQGIQQLEIGFNHFGDEGMEAFAQSAPYSHLRTLQLDSNNLTVQGARTLADIDMPQLHTLTIGINESLGDDGACALCKAPWFDQLRSLRINAIGLTDTGGIALAETEAIAGLRMLDLSGSKNPMGDQGALALALSPHTQSIKDLIISPHHMTPQACLEILLTRPEVDTYKQFEKKVPTKLLKAKAKEEGHRRYSQMNKTQLLALLRGLPGDS